MGRKQRRFFSGGIYHIIHRGHNRSNIFNEQTDKLIFLDIIKTVRDAGPFNVLYYVLMDNHFHMIIEMKEFPIDKAMQKISMAYGKYYNKKYECSGTVYGDRYKALAVSNTKYLKTLILYIANNPVKAGIARHPSEYRWCAHMEIVSQRQVLVATQRLFEILGDTPEKGAEVYHELIRQILTLASKAANLNAFINERRAEQLEDMLAELINNRTSIGHICAGKRDALSIQIRREFIALATSDGYKSTEIARTLNVSERCVRAIRAGLVSGAEPVRAEPVSGTEPEVTGCDAGTESPNSS